MEKAWANCSVVERCIYAVLDAAALDRCKVDLNSGLKIVTLKYLR